MPQAPRRALVSAAALSALLLFQAGCLCEQDQSVDRRGRKIGADVEKPERLAFVPEQEPNDSPDKATAYTLVTTGPGSTAHKPFEGTLSSGDDLDYVRIPAQTDLSMRTLSVEPLTEGADIVLLWGADDRKQNLAPISVEESIKNLTNAAITIGIKVASADTFPVKYQLRLGRSTVSGGIEVEPGPKEGFEIAMPGDLQGLVNYAGDADLYTVPLEGAEGGRALRLEFLPPPNTAMKVTPLVDGEALTTFEVEARPAEQLRPMVWPNLRLTRDARALEVRVSAEDKATQGVAEAYTLKALLHPPIPKGRILETEPNDPGSPMLVQEPSEILGYLHHPDDQDVFVVQVGEPRRAGLPPTVLHVRFAGEGMDWALDLDTPEDKRGSTKEAINEAPFGKPEIICNRLLNPGETRIVVSYKQGRRARAVKAAQANPFGHYKLSIEARPARKEELEPNEDLKSASELSLGGRTRGFLYPAGDIDVYKFEIKRKDLAPPPAPAADAGLPPDDGFAEVPSVLSVELSLGGVRLNLALDVIDEEGLPVAQSDAAPAGTTEKLQLDLPPGIYYARVKAGPRAATCDAPYVLRLQKK